MLRRVLVTMSVLVLAACGARPHTFDVLAAARAQPVAVARPVVHPDVSAVRRWNIAAFNAAYFAAAYDDWIANQPPPPAPISDRRCPPGQVKFLIGYTFGLSAPWGESVAMRESGCSPTAYNPSGAAGIFQLLGHQDLLDAVCPPHGDWADATCNIKAAWALYLADGIAPWRL